MPIASSTPLRVLLVEDSVSDAELVVRQLHKGGFEVGYERVENAGQLHTALVKQKWDIVLSDFNLPAIDAAVAMAIVREYDQNMPFIVVSDNIGDDVAVTLMRAGASDYLLKNNLQRLAAAVQREVDNARVRNARHDSDVRFQQLFNLTPVPLAFINQEGDVFDLNARFQQTFGYCPSDLPTIKEWWQLAYPEPNYRRQVVDTWNAAVQAATEQHTDIPAHEYCVSCKSGDVRIMLISGIIIGDSLLVTFFDITERKNTETELKRHIKEAERVRAALLGVLEDQREAQAALRENEARYRLLFAENPVPMWVYDINTLAFIAVNDAAVAHYGYSCEEFYTMGIADLSPPDGQETAQQKSVQADCYGLSGIWQQRRKDGSLLWAEMTGHNLAFEGRAARIVLAHDVTQRLEAEHQLRLSAQVFESSREGILITNADNKIVSVNKAYTDITGYTPAEVLGKPPSIVSSGKQDKKFYAAMWRSIIADGCWQGEVVNRRKNGELYPQWLSVSVIRNKNGQIIQYIGILSDLSEHHSAQERIQFLSNFDVLTQLPNRALLQDRAQLALASAKRINASVALMYLDLDRFKTINESLGPSIGDQLLKDLSVRLDTQLDSDYTLCRQGGDEFILLLPNTDAEDAAHIARKILDIVAQEFVVGGHRLTLTVSIGIAQFPEDGDTFEQLAQSADAALFRAKQNGRNNFQFFTRQMHEQAQETLQIENELRCALEQNELLLYYQPQVDAKTGKIVGAEALIRWQHPQKGMVPPGCFIPIAEESGLIIDIGDWVLQTAIQQTAAWQAAGLGIVPIAVNLSVVQFRQDTLYQKVVQALRLSKLDPTLLELELTEGIAMENTERTIGVLNQLHALGVALSIDDFGTGYSSLSYLKRFKINKLKIDQSFVRDLGRNPEDAAIVTAIIGMAKSLGFKTIAEGVETQEQLDFLRGQQCDEIQGYFFSKPIPAEQFAALLRGNRVLGIAN
ncbi:EAL domain-containing protein [Methylovulum psychrotolerans]|uniref:EAL domain-containing protein n=1 Tax=Methylovulum psychrotolerans TaxID=1704499 RepID=UPI001BFF5E28|nr:EAL domain-containing protein [Methylovulum psychrotolerans]MBT9099514.1 EAL domain-containing protein [Methylovulum psychrotolerans]